MKEKQHNQAHSSSKAILYAFVANLAALSGLTLALVFLGWAAWTGDPVYDPMGSIAIGLVLILVSLFIALRIRSLIALERRLKEDHPEIGWCFIEPDLCD